MDSVIFQNLAVKFAQTKQKQPLVVFDVDDVLWSLKQRVADEVQIDLDRGFGVFRIDENPRLTTAEKDRIISLFADPRMFQDIQFYPGVRDILRPRELGAIVKINSNSYSPEVARLKIEQLLATIPGLTREDIQSNVITHKQSGQKALDRNTTILIDDSPHNLAISPALANITPLHNNPWTNQQDPLQLVGHDRVVFCQDLVQINDFVYRAIEHMMHTI